VHQVLCDSCNMGLHAVWLKYETTEHYCQGGFSKDSFIRPHHEYRRHRCSLLLHRHLVIYLHCQSLEHVWRPAYVHFLFHAWCLPVQWLVILDTIISCLIRSFIMVALCNRADHYIFALWFLSSFFPHLISAVGDWMSTILPHMVWP